MKTYASAFGPGQNPPRLINEDKRVRAMAKKAGMWAPLREANRRRQTRVVIHNLTVYGAFADGYVAVICNDPIQLLEVMARLSKEFGLKLTGIHPGGEVH
jgi:hypothetical protein